MAEETRIEWCDSTFNPWIGCTKISPACDHCYAESYAKRTGQANLWAGERRRTSAANWKKPLKWNAQGMVCEDCGQPPNGRDCPCGQVGAIGKLRRRRVFCASLADVFDNQVPDEWRADLLDMIRLTPNLDWLILTKRIGNWERLLIGETEEEESGVFEVVRRRRNSGMPNSEAGKLLSFIAAWAQGYAPHNVWIGATICNQEEADRDIQKLLNTPAHIRFLSVEPMLGPIDLNRVQHLKMIDWIICGGESGPGARPMHPDWVRSLRDQCQAAGVPFLYKQWGDWAPNCLCDTKQPHATTPRPEPGKPGVMFRCGKKAAGRIIDGRTWDEFPEACHEKLP